jgi:hypothetical protein
VANRDRQSGKIVISGVKMAKMAKMDPRTAKTSILTRQRQF